MVWSNQDVQFLIKNNNLSAKELSKSLGYSESSIHHKRSKLKCLSNRTPSNWSRRIRNSKLSPESGTNNGNQTQFFAKK